MLDWRGVPSVDAWNAVMTCVQNMQYIVVPNRYVLGLNVFANQLILNHPHYLDGDIICYNGMWVPREGAVPRIYTISRGDIYYAYNLASHIRNYGGIPWMRGQDYLGTPIDYNGVFPINILDMDFTGKPPGEPNPPCAYCSNPAGWCITSGPLYDRYWPNTEAIPICHIHGTQLLNGSNYCGGHGYYGALGGSLWPGWHVTLTPEHNYLKTPDYIIEPGGGGWSYIIGFNRLDNVHRGELYAGMVIGNTEIALPEPLCLCPDGTEILEASLEITTNGMGYAVRTQQLVYIGNDVYNLQFEFDEYQTATVLFDLFGVRPKNISSSEYNEQTPRYMLYEKIYLGTYGSVVVRSGESKKLVIDFTQALRYMFAHRREYLTFVFVFRPADGPSIPVGMSLADWMWSLCNGEYYGIDYAWRQVLIWSQTHTLYLPMLIKDFSFRISGITISNIGFRIRLPESAKMEIDWRNWPSMGYPAPPPE